MSKAAERNPRTNAWVLRGRSADLLRMRDEEGLSFGEMATSLGVTAEGARQAYHRAKNSPAARTEGATTTPGA